MGEFVNLLNAAGGAFAAWAGPVLIQSSVLIVILAALDLVLRKRVKAVVRYWIWLLVLAKLVLSPSFTSPTSLAYWVGGKLPVLPARVEPVARAPVALDSGPLAGHASEEPAISHGEPVARAALPEGGPIVSSPPRVLDSSSSAGHASEDSAIRLAERAAPASPTISRNVPLTWQALALLAWAVVVVVMVALLIQRALFVRGLVARSYEPPQEIAELLRQCGRRMGVRANLAVRLSPLSASPSVCGLRRPVILIPEEMLARLQGNELKSVLFHELAHVKRGDLWLNLVQTLLQVVYFYHPLLWAANARIRKVREQAVDETVLAAMGEEAEDYPRTLLSVSRLAFGQSTLSLRLLGVVESKKALMDRIRHIVSRPFPQTAKLGFTGCLLVLVVAVTLLPMASAAPEQAKTERTSPAGGLPAASEVTPTGATTDSQGQPLERAEAAPPSTTVGESGDLPRVEAGDQDKTMRAKEEIAPMAVQASSSDTGSPAVNLINGKGLSDGDREGQSEHSDDPACIWRSAKGDAKSWVEFDFGSPQRLTDIFIWNYNEAGHADRGVRKLDLSIWTPEAGWQKIRPGLPVDPARGNNGYDEPTLVKLDVTMAQKIRLDNLVNLGDPEFTGLSKVKFFRPPGLNAFKLSPADGAERVEINGLELTWLAGNKAKAHNVYLGISPENLKLQGKVEQAGVQVSHLRSNTRYYWRVDEVQADGSTTTGTTCTFTTGGLAAWWKLDDGSGNIARDSSGGGNQGAVHGEAAWMKDSFGSALAFNGVDTCVDCGSAAGLMQVGSVSVAAWINLGARGRDAKIVSNQDGGSGYKLAVYTNNKVEFEIRVLPDITPTTNRFEPGGTELQPYTWYHVVGVYEKGRCLRTYVNGQLDREFETPEIAAISKGPLVIGRESFANSSRTYWWLGALRDVCVITYALSPDEVKALYSGTTPTALTAPPVSSAAADGQIVLAPLNPRARPVPANRAKSSFGGLATASLNAWVKLHVLGDRMVVLETLKRFSDSWVPARHKVVGSWSEKETLDYLQGRLKDKDSLPIRIQMYYLPQAKDAAANLRQKIFALAREAKADRDTEVRLELSVWMGSGESPFYIRAGEIRTFYPRPVPRPDGGRRWLTNGLVDPNDLEQHILWRLTMPKCVPLTFRIEYDEASYALAKQVADTAKAVARRVGLTDLVGVAGTLVEAPPESTFLGKWQALGSGVIQNVEIQPAGVCQVTMGEGSDVLKAGTSVKGSWSWTVKEILLDIGDPVDGIQGYPPYRYRATVNEKGDLVVERGEIWLQGSFMHTRPPQTIYRKVQ